MNFGLPIAAQTLLLAGAGLALLTVVAYVLKMRRRRFEVPFSMLWQRVLREKEATSFWRHLRRLLSLLLMLGMIGALLFAALDPELGNPSKEARNVVLILDSSASMATTDEADGQSRFDVAKRRVLDIIASLGEADEAMVMKMDGQTTPISRFVADKPMLKRSVEAVSLSDTPADLRRALSAAADALRERRNPMIILIGDGAYEKDVLQSAVIAPPVRPAAKPTEGGDKPTDKTSLAEIDLSGIDVRFSPVGKQGENVGIVSFNVRRYPANRRSFEVFIEVQNFGKEAATRKLLLCSGAEELKVWKDVTLAPGERTRNSYPDLGGETEHQLRAELRPVSSRAGCAQTEADPTKQPLRDLFPLDDVAYSLLPKQKSMKILLVTPDNLYLEAFALVYDNVQADKVTPAEYDAAMADGQCFARSPERDCQVSSGDYNVVVFDGVTPEKLPPPQTSLLYFGPRGDHGPFKVSGLLKDPKINEINGSHPTMRWVSLADAHFDDTAVFEVNAAEQEVALARATRATIIAAKTDGPRKILAFGFGLSDLDAGGTDMVLRVAFPMLLVNALDWFAGAESDLITTYNTGTRFRVPVEGAFGIPEADVRTPDGNVIKAPIVDNVAMFYGHQIGMHQVSVTSSSGQTSRIDVAANLADAKESAITPRPNLILGKTAPDGNQCASPGACTELKPPEGFSSTYRQKIWLYLCFAFLALLFIEWITYNRRITV